MWFAWLCRDAGIDWAGAGIQSLGGFCLTTEISHTKIRLQLRSAPTARQI